MQQHTSQPVPSHLTVALPAMPPEVAKGKNSLATCTAISISIGVLALSLPSSSGRTDSDHFNLTLSPPISATPLPTPLSSLRCHHDHHGHHRQPRLPVITDATNPRRPTYLWGVGDRLPVLHHGARPPRQASLARLVVGVVLCKHTSKMGNHLPNRQ